MKRFWLILAAAATGLAVGTAFVWRNASRPSDGARLEPGSSALRADGLLLTPLDPQTGGLQPGDRLVAIGGTSIQTWSQSLAGAPPGEWPAEPGSSLVYTVARDGEEFDIPIVLGSYPLWPIILQNWSTLFFSLVFLLVAGFVFVRQPSNPAGQVLFLAAAGVASSSAWSFGLTAADFADGLGFWLYKIATVLFYGLFWTGGFHFAAIFPQRLPVFDHHRWLLTAAYLFQPILLAVYLPASRIGTGSLLDWFSRWTNAESLHAAVFLTLTIVCIAVQFRRSPGGVARQQIRWVTLAGIVSGIGGLLFYILPPLLGLDPINSNAAGLIALPFPIGLAIAILRHNLFDIDQLINRTLVYGALTASTVALYVFSVGTLGELLQLENRNLLAFLTAGIVAVLFQPLRDWLQRGVNRWMYGERDDPAAVLNRLGRSLDHAGAPDAALQGIVETISTALKLPFAAIELDGAAEPAATYGVPSTSAGSFPLVYQGQQVGRLVVAGRGPENELTQRDLDLLENIAFQAGVVAHNVRLTADLRRSRQQLVTAREEERRRIRRDLHDGLGPQLASQTLTLKAIEKLLEKQPDAALDLVRELKSQSRSAIDDIRRLIYDLRPPALDDLGLVEALRETLQRFPGKMRTSLQAPNSLPELPAAVELAAFRIILEAVNNAHKHAGAGTCKVAMTIRNGDLHLDIRDDGRGIPANPVKGVGLDSMQARAEELGGHLEIRSPQSGGTLVRARLPL